MYDLGEEAEAIRTVSIFLRSESRCYLASLGFDNRRVRGHLYRASHFSKLESEIEPACLPAREWKVVGDESLETGSGGRQTIGSGRKIRNLVLPARNLLPSRAKDQYSDSLFRFLPTESSRRLDRALLRESWRNPFARLLSR